VSYFQARYYLAPQGRFNSPDPANFGADILNPSSWNGYSYVMNQPLSEVDPNGLQAVCSDGVCMGGGTAPPSGGDPGGSAGPGFNLSASPVQTAPANPGISWSWFSAPSVQYASIGAKVVTKTAQVLQVVPPMFDMIVHSPRALMQSLDPPHPGIQYGIIYPIGAAPEASEGLVAGRSFGSFAALKRSLGPAGEGMAWHHVVEQSKVDEFGKGAIHNAANVRNVTRGVNQAIADYYSSKQLFTGGLTVRQWLSGQSWAEQFRFGVETLFKALKGQL
jgi:hypothetical protein